MRYEFNVNVTEQDYLDFNMFISVRSPYGKKTFTTTKIFVSVLVIMSALLLLIKGRFSADAFIGVIPLFIFWAFVLVFLPKYYSWILKTKLNLIKKDGKLPFSTTSVMTFYDDAFTETTADNKTEHKYTAIERVSVVDGKMIYIHINSLMSYILPMACIGSKNECDGFLSFLQSLGVNVNYY